MYTPYGAKLTGESVLPEYPRPQMTRASFLNLNGLWDYTYADGDGLPEDFDGEILVPFPPESKLSRVEKTAPKGKDLWYRRYFTLPEGFDRGRVLLHFGAVDQTAAVYCNGQEVCRHAGGYTAFTAELTGLLEEDENELLVQVRDVLADGPCSYGAQKRYSPWSGIWQTVWLESVPAEYIDSVIFRPIPEEDVLEITIVSGGDAVAGQPCTVVLRGIRYEVPTDEPTRLPADNLQRWTPEKPKLYGVEITLGEDTVKCYCAMRSLTLGWDGSGGKRLLLNGKPCFLNGVVYQGYWPDGLSTPPTDEALSRDVAAARAMGFNAIRLRDKVECARFYWHCDRMGIMVIQGMPAGGGNPLPRVPGVKDSSYQFFGRKDAEGRNQFKRELRETVTQLVSAPSVVIWELFDEGRGQFDSQNLSDYVKDLDGSRLIDHASGGADMGIGDICSVHSAGVKWKYKPDGKKRHVLLSSFGQLGSRAEGHCWGSKSVAAVRYESPQRLSFAIQELYDECIRPAEQQGLIGCMYYQLTDVENEISGFLSYDRMRCKIAPSELKKLIDIRPAAE